MELIKSKIENINTFICNHTSFLVMGVGSLSLFVSNILLKDYLTIDQYFEYSIIITLLALLNSFGALGVDQTFLRLSEIKDKKIILIDRKLVPLALVSIVISTTITLIYCQTYLDLSLNIFVTFSLFIGISACMLIYNLLRITSNFVYAQLIQNLWRFGTLAFTVLFIFETLSFDSYINYLTSVIWISTISIVLLTRNSFCVYYSNKIKMKLIFEYVFHFFISLVSVSFLGQGDRLMIESMFSKEDFGNYFYLGTFFLFPFSFLQSYIGFKEVVKMKSKNINMNNLLGRIYTRSIAFSCFLFLTSYLLYLLNFLKIDFSQYSTHILLFLIIGNIKMLYALFSSHIGVKASVSQIKKMNLLHITSGIVIFLFFSLFDMSVTLVLIYFVFVWLTRLLIWGAVSNKISSYAKN